MTTFSLHPQLAADTYAVTQLTLCDVLLMNDSRYPWLILVPRVADITDLHQLPSPESELLWQEIGTVSKALESATKPFKLNVAALGNMVPQLHIHIIARNQDDAAWPGPVWGIGDAVPYADQESSKLVAAIVDQLT